MNHKRIILSEKLFANNFEKNSHFLKKDIPYWVDTLWCLNETQK